MKKMVLSKAGRCAYEHWQAIPLHYENIAIDEFAVMPNHLRGIIEITGPEIEPKFKDPAPKDTGLVGPKAGSLSHVVRCFKGGVTQWCKTGAPGFQWQIGFHDRIIRGPKSLEAVRQYIRDNPKNWGKDEDYVQV
ncbi:MAG TPA: hypothetical protein VNW97_17845 [Candidatus Saccharimonadales bacterium]|jgi:putative transposase|nr:hypothetical protein [Candidatus Saccharimonadales bacterium]